MPAPVFYCSPISPHLLPRVPRQVNEAMITHRNVFPRPQSAPKARRKCRPVNPANHSTRPTNLLLNLKPVAFFYKLSIFHFQNLERNIATKQIYYEKTPTPRLGA
jgi:hypothetical protein